MSEKDPPAGFLGTWSADGPFWDLFGDPGIYRETRKIHFGDLGIHRETSWDTLGVQTYILSTVAEFWNPIGGHFGVILITFS